MKIIHTSDFKNNTILAHRGIKCVIRGYAFVRDTKKWLAKKYQDRYAFEDITLEELCNNCVLVTDEDKNDPDVLNNLFDVTYEPCLELTVPETTDEKGTVLGGEKFGTYKIRINSALNNKIRKGIQGTYRAIVLIGEKYTEDDWHVITEGKSYITMFIYFDGSSPECQGEDENGLTIGENSAYTINLQFSLSQLKDVPGESVLLDADYKKIMQESKQKDQTTIKLSLPGIFLVPSGKEYKNRVEIEDNVNIKHEGIAYMDKTFNLIPNTYKNNNIFNVTPRVNIFDEHDDKFVKPQLLLSYGKNGESAFDAQSIGFEYDPSYFKMNEKAPSAATRFDLFGGATKRETSTYDDTRYDPMSGYLRLLCDRGYHEGGEDNMFILANDSFLNMSHGSMMVADDNQIVEGSETTHVIDSRGTRASAISAGHIIDSEKIYAQNMNGITAFASQQASATTDLPGYDRTKDDPYMCPDCQGTGKIYEKITKYIPIVYWNQGGAPEIWNDYYAIDTDGDDLKSIYLVHNDTEAIAGKVAELSMNSSRFFNTQAEADAAVAKWLEDHPRQGYETWNPYDTIVKTYAVVKKYVVGYVGAGFAIHWAVRKTDDDYINIEIGAGGGDIDVDLLTSENITIDLAYDTEAEAQAFVAELEASWPEELPSLSPGNHPVYVSREFLSEDASEGTPEPCPRCGGDGRYGNYSLPGRLAMMGLNVSSMEFNGYNNFFIGHKGLMSNFGHDAIIFGNHNACGNKEYNMCQHCLGTGLVECDNCLSGTDHPTGKVSAYADVTCSSCYGFGYVTYSAEICGKCSGAGTLPDGSVCPICLGHNKYSGVNPTDWTGSYCCSSYITASDAIYLCQLCSGEKTIQDKDQIITVLCPKCSGYGQMPDPACSGMGFIQDNEHKMQTSACPTCSETMITCPACSGQGYSGDASSGERCELCGGDKRVCNTCSGTGEHECTMEGTTFSGKHYVKCPECNTSVAGDTSVKTCPVCSGLDIEGDPEWGGVSYVSMYQKDKIMACFPKMTDPVMDKFMIDHGVDPRSNLYATLVLHKCPKCYGTGWITKSLDRVLMSNPDWTEGSDEDPYIFMGYLKENSTDDIVLVDSIDDATAWEEWDDADAAYNTWLANQPECHPHYYKENESIFVTCPTCNGYGGDIINYPEDGDRVKCPYCNEIYFYTTTQNPYGSYFEIHPAEDTVPLRAPAAQQKHLSFSGARPGWQQFVHNDFISNVGHVKNADYEHPKKIKTVGYHTCDLCEGRQYLSLDDVNDKLKPYLGDDPAQTICEWETFTDGRMGDYIYVRTPRNSCVGVVCPKCCNMNLIVSAAQNRIATNIDDGITKFARAFSGMNYYDSFSHDNFYLYEFEASHTIETETKDIAFLDGGFTAACNACNYMGSVDRPPWTHEQTTVGYVLCPECNGNGIVPCEACEGKKHWLCPTCNGRGEVDFRPIVAYEDGKVVAVGDGYFYKNLMPNQDTFNMYRDYVNIKPEDNCDLDVGQYLKRMNLFSVENHGLLTVHNNNYDEVPDSNVVHQVAADFFAVRSWAKYDSLQERFANLQNGCYAPDAIYFTKRTAHNEEWKLRIRELDYLIHDSYIKTNASWLKTAALNQAISEFYKKNNTFTLRLGPIITYAWKGVKGSKGAKGTKGWKGTKGVKGVTLGLKGKKGMKGMKGLKGTKGYKGMTLQIVNKRYKYYIEDILAAVRTEFGKYISNNGNLGKNPETYTFYCVNGDPTENLYFKGVRLRKMANGNYQTLNAVKGIKPAQVQRIVYKDNGYFGEYGVMNFNYAYSNKFLT